MRRGMIPFPKCPICSGEAEERTVEKKLETGVRIIEISAQAEVCLDCEEKFYSMETVRELEQIRTMDRIVSGYGEKCGDSWR